jgi:hypothetical protein
MEILYLELPRRNVYFWASRLLELGRVRERYILVVAPLVFLSQWKSDRLQRWSGREPRLCKHSAPLLGGVSQVSSPVLNRSMLHCSSIKERRNPFYALNMASAWVSIWKVFGFHFGFFAQARSA